MHITPFVNGYVDITSVTEEKRRLIECYQSQNNYCRYDHITMGLAAWNARLLENNATPRYAEIFFTLPANEFLQLVENFYFQNMTTTYRGDEKIIPGLSAIHNAITAKSQKRDFLKLHQIMKTVTGRFMSLTLMALPALFNFVFDFV